MLAEPRVPGRASRPRRRSWCTRPMSAGCGSGSPATAPCAGHSRDAGCARSAMGGAIVQPMVPPGVELIVGINHDPTFGPLVLFGMGGFAAELQRDTALAVPPLTDADVDRLVRSLRGSPLLFGFRNSDPVDVEAHGRSARPDRLPRAEKSTRSQSWTAIRSSSRRRRSSRCQGASGDASHASRTLRVRLQRSRHARH